MSHDIYREKPARAFPAESRTDVEYNWVNKGMTMHEYYMGCLVPPFLNDASPNWNPTDEDISKIVTLSSRFADAMIAKSK